MAKLNDRQRRFANFVISGMAAGRAYEKAGYLSKGGAADVNASKMLRNTKVTAYMEELRSEARSAAVMTARKRMEFLSMAIVTPIGEIDENSPLCADSTSDEVGEEVIRTRIKKIDPLRALDLLNKMDGAYAPERHKVDVDTSLTELLKRI